MLQDSKNGTVCVTGGTGFLGSWMIKRLLEDGYSVNATLRIDLESKMDISFITNLPGASERLQIFYADLDRPETFAPAIEGCTGVIHMAHPFDFAEKETEEVKIRRVTTGLEGILRACADSKTVTRVVYNSSISAAAFSSTPGHLAEKTALDLAEKLGLDLVSILQTWTTGPFICPEIPDPVKVSMALIFGDEKHYPHLKDSSLVHIDDVARAHIHLLEHQEAKGRYIVSAVEFKIEELCEFISARYTEYKMPTADSWKDVIPVKLSGLSTKKLEETGFKYEYGLEDMFDGAIKCCKEKGLL